MKKKRILILLAGGTIAQLKSNGRDTNVTSEKGKKALITMINELINTYNKNTIFNTENVFPGDSTEMDKDTWETMIKIIEQNYSFYDGFLIIMGTNTLAYASSALSFALRYIKKTIIFTGAQIPANEPATDARNNLINSIRVLLLGSNEKDKLKLKPGVYVVFGSKIILGCRAKKSTESALDAFISYNTQNVGRIGVNIKLHSEYVLDQNNEDVETLYKIQKYKSYNIFNDSIICLTLVPGLKTESILQLINNGIKAVILRAFGAGDIPENLFSALAKAKEKKIPIVVTTQCPDGATMMGLNEPGHNVKKYKIIQAYDMSMEAITTKLMWLLAQGFSYENIRNEMQKNYIGEINLRLL